MNPISEKVKDQFIQLNGSIQQVAKAGRGLLTLVHEESKKQFSDLVKTGKAQQNKGINLIDQVKGSLPESFDVKTSAKTLSIAARGLFKKAKADSEKLFNELVTLASEEAAPKRKAARKAA